MRSDIIPIADCTMMVGVIAVQLWMSFSPHRMVHVKGCDLEEGGAVCRPKWDQGKDQKLVFWVEASASERIVAEYRGASWVTVRLKQTGSTNEGRQFVLKKLPSVGVVQITAYGALPQRPYQLELRPAEYIRGEMEDDQALSAKRAQRLRVRLGGPLADQVRAHVLYELARAEEESYASERWYAEALELNKKLGLVSQESDNALDLAYVLSIDQHRQVEARHVLEAHAKAINLDGKGYAWLPYRQAQIAEVEGDIRTAQAHLAEAIQRRTELKISLWSARLEENILLMKLGLVGEACEHWKQYLAPRDEPANSCKTALAKQRKAWILLESAEGGRNGQAPVCDGDPSQLLRDAMTLYRDHHCEASDADISSLQVELVRAALQKQDDLAAERLLDELEHTLRKSSPPNPTDLFGAAEARGRLELLRGNPKEALRNFEDADRLAKQQLGLEEQWRGALYEAKAYLALQQDSRAQLALEQAERLAESLLLVVPVEAKNGAFVFRHDQGAQLLVQLLLSHGKTAEAYQVARTARARLLMAWRNLSRLTSLTKRERDRWEQAVRVYQHTRRKLIDESKGDLGKPRPERESRELERSQRFAKVISDLAIALGTLREQPSRWQFAEPRDGDLSLLCFPLPEGSVCFAQGETLHAIELKEKIGELGPPLLSKAVLEPLRPQIERARRLRILAYGPLQAIDFQSLPWDGAVLLAKLPVVYGLDLPGIDGSRQSAAARPSLLKRALLAVDPSGDLAGARQEGAVVAKSLKQAGWLVQRLVNPAQAIEDSTVVPISRQRLLVDLAQFELFHYAGHGKHSGPELPESHLIVPDGDVSIGDLLGQPSLPRFVVLSSCDVGSTDEILSLGQAFVARGSETVIAAVRPVSDALTAKLAETMYQEAARSQNFDLAEALRSSQLKLRQETGGGDWASAFRVLVN